MAIAPFAQRSRAGITRGTLHVADLARRAEVTPATVRYYARIGLLNPGRDRQNGYRRFDTEDLHRISFIRKAQALGLTIADIRALLECIERHDDSVCDQVVERVRNRLDEIRRQCAELEATAGRIEGALEQWSEGAWEPSGYCPLIEGVDLGQHRPQPDLQARVRVRAGGPSMRGTGDAVAGSG